MAEPLAVVPALNTMIPLCSLLVFGASVSRSSLVVKVVSKAVLLALTTLAWLSQPLSKIQNIVTQVWGHDTRWPHSRRPLCLPIPGEVSPLSSEGRLGPWEVH